MDVLEHIGQYSVLRLPRILQLCPHLLVDLQKACGCHLRFLDEMMYGLLSGGC